MAKTKTVSETIERNIENETFKFWNKDLGIIIVNYEHAQNLIKEKDSRWELYNGQDKVQDSKVKGNDISTVIRDITETDEQEQPCNGCGA